MLPRAFSLLVIAGALVWSNHSRADDNNFTTMTVKRLPDGSAKVIPSAYTVLKDAGVFSTSPPLDVGTDIQVSPKAQIALPNNKKVVIDVVAKVPKKEIAKAMAARIIPKLPYVGTAVAVAMLEPKLAGLLDEWIYNPNTKEWTKPKTTPGFACQASSQPITWCGSHRGEDHSAEGFCQVSDDGNCTYYGTLVPSYTPGTETFTTPSLADKIAQESGWPTSATTWATDLSNAATVAGDATVTSISGPTSATGDSKTTTRTSSTGETLTTTENTQYQITYNGDTYNITTTTTSTTVNQAGDVVSDETTTKDETPAETKPEEQVSPASDPDMPTVPDFYQQKYPDGLAGVWDARTSAIKSTPLFSLVDALTPASLGSGGGCPTFMLPVNLGRWNFGTFDISPPCVVWDFGRVFLMLGALLLARALIFGG